MRVLLFLYLLPYCYVAPKRIKSMTIRVEGDIFCQFLPANDAQITFFDTAPVGRRRRRLSKTIHPKDRGMFVIEGKAKKLFKPFLMVKHWCNQKGSPITFCIDIPSRHRTLADPTCISRLSFAYHLCRCASQFRAGITADLLTIQEGHIPNKQIEKQVLQR
ncbi:unnamed protein product [Cylicocyclus nassatus]|uniref:Uncharacterized protein n=1 Tax=Cylicocyclus nassatus TaxID=53992 RepID=A0AA36GK83_CYLNA|nr:unnamed protein product [Cylicocyclus nassatus]